jgi:hypothetical protein
LGSQKESANGARKRSGERLWKRPEGVENFCTSQAGYADTISITSAEEFDSNGNVLANAKIVSDGGFNPNHPNVAAPEPPSLVMLGAGLLGLMLFSLKKTMN